MIKSGRKCKPRKCQLFRPWIEYLGYVISKKRVAPDEKKIEKIKKCPFSSTGLEILSFLGHCNYYRDLIHHFAEYSAPLYAVSRENKIVKTPDLEENFEKLDKLICSTDVLSIPDPERPFILETDASLIALGAVLKQKENENEFPVSFFSHAL